MKKIFIKTFLILPLVVFFGFSVLPNKVNATSGILRVCKMIVSPSGQIVTSKNNLPNSNFSIKISTTTNISNSLVYSLQFNAQNFTPNTALVFENNFYDSECINHTVEVGTYYYSTENISGDTNSWETPKYYDGVNSYNVLNLASEYSSQLFNSDPNDDSLINIVSDGLVSVPLDGVRTIIVLNKIKETPKPLSCEANVELLKNGGFEDLSIIDNQGKWQIFSWDKEGLGWKTNMPDRYGLEVQSGHSENNSPVWQAFSGNKYAEIDAGMFNGNYQNVYQDIPTIPNKTYTLSFAYSPRPNQGQDDNAFKVLANGLLIDTISANGLNNSVPVWTSKQYTFTATTTITKIEIIDIGKDNNPSGYGMLVDAFSLKCNKDVVTNTPPLISLIGQNPANITVGQPWVEPGATSTDKEDGDLTNKIVITGQVNINVPGTYTLTYTVTDSGGLSASTTRSVVVSPKAECKAINLDGFVGEYLATYKTFGGETQLGTSTLGVNALGGEIDFLGSSFTNPDSRVYIMEKSNGLDFSFDNGPASKGKVLIVWDGKDNNFNNINYTGLSGVDLSYGNQRDRIKFIYRSDFVDNKDIKITFFVYTDANNASKKVMSLYGPDKTIISGEVKFSDFQNFIGNGADFKNVGAVAIEVDATSRDGHDFTMGGFEIPCVEAPKNTPPTINLIGNNPINIYVGDVFVDPFATANDLEDGNITANIIKTGSINASTTGTYTLTYTVTDSGGLSASTTRSVVVSPKPENPVHSCLVPDSLSDTEIENIILGWDGNGTFLQDIFNANNINKNIVSDQKQYQVWNNLSQNNIKVSVKVELIGENALLNSVFGYHTKNNGNSFVPLFKSGNVSGYSNTPIFAVSNSTTTDFSVLSGSGIGFAIKTENTDLPSIDLWSTENALSKDLKDHSIVYEIAKNTYIIVFEDLPINGSDKDYNDIMVKVTILNCGELSTNTPPLISLIGQNPANITVGQPWVEPGATSTDKEDGDLTNKIVITGQVNINVPGTYTLTYTVTDSGGLSASTTRSVVVSPVSSPDPKGKIRVCLVLADEDNVVATTSLNLPFGTFNLKLGTTTNIDGGVLAQSWTTSTFSPNSKIISSTQNDANCITISDLNLTDYYYNELSMSGSLWQSVKYNDQYNQPVNNVFDFFAYSPELFTATTTDDISRNLNSDGNIKLISDRREHTLVIFAKYKKATQCLIPDITSALSAQAIVGQSFSYEFTASSTATTTLTLNVATSTLPLGLSYSTTTKTISGIPTQTGTFVVDLSASNSCGIANAKLSIVVNAGGGGGGGGCQGNCSTPNPTPITSGGGGGGNGPIIPNTLKIFNEKVVEITKGIALVTWDTNLSATRQVGYGNVSVTNASSTSPFGYATSTIKISSPLAVTHSMAIPIESGKTYYFRPVSSDTNTTVIGKELVLNPVTSSGGGQCYYLFDYLKKGWNNNPVEVKKLQVFLRDLEGFNVEITGVYDDQTIVSLNAFQNRYKDDVLTPWGHTSPTSFTYITTKKKVNEIYCKRAFPVTVAEQAEIDAYRKFLLGLRDAGIVLSDTTIDQSSQPSVIETDEVGSNEDFIPLIALSTSTNATNTQTTLAGISDTTRNLASSFTSTILRSGRSLGNLASAIFTWPYKMVGSWFDRFSSEDNSSMQCQNKTCLNCTWLNWLLILVIIFLSYLLYRERRSYRKIVELNKEIDMISNK